MNLYNIHLFDQAMEILTHKSSKNDILDKRSSRVQLSHLFNNLRRILQRLITKFQEALWILFKHFIEKYDLLLNQLSFIGYLKF